MTMQDEIAVSTVEVSDRTVVLRARGTLNARSTPILLQHCRAVKERRKNLVLNLSEVLFIASSGIGGLLALVEEFRESDRSVRLAALSTAVDSVVRLLNLASFLSIDVDEVAAVEALGSR
jgi:anti-anti-sigma factor